MSKIKQQFSEMRKNTPKRIQWLLLVAAFIVVLILLTLMFTGSDEESIAQTDSVPVDLVITPDEIEWGNIIVGEKKSQTIRVSATAPATVLKVEREREVEGFSVRSTCPNAKVIDAGFACTVTVDYVPTAALSARSAPIFIEWRAAGEPDKMSRKTQITVVVGASLPEQPKPVEEPKPVVMPEPEPVVVPEPEPMPEPEPEIDLIAPVAPFQAAPVAEPTVALPSEGCSDFAMPGYNAAGRQIGWIKPSKGAYYFHPFSDTECEDPTGVYNPDNGIITDIDNSGKRIGTDAEHIGYARISGGQIPELSNPVTPRNVNRAQQLDTADLPASGGMMRLGGDGTLGLRKKTEEAKTYLGSGEDDAVVSSMPYDRQFILRQYKPIPATIVSEIQADPNNINEGLPVRATVDRNVYSDNGRNVIIPAGTLLMGYVTGNLPGPYTTIGRMQIKWYQFIRPDGVEFNFGGNNNPFSGDAQGRVGVPGHGSTDYLEQFFMPMLTAIVPAAVNLIAPVSDAFVNQIDLDNNTVVQSGTVRSSELAKNEIITAWNQVAQKLIVDMMDNTVPPFSIAAGTRITVYSPVDLIVTCGPEDGPNAGKKCAITEYGSKKRTTVRNNATPNYSDGTWTGQVRSFNLDQYCDETTQSKVRKGAEAEISAAGFDYRTVLFYCQSRQYQAINNAKQEQVWQNQQSAENKESIAYVSNQGQQAYNEQVLGLTYDEETGAIQNPFESTESADEEVVEVLTCEDGSLPDANGCCAGEIYTDMGDQGFNCCPESGGDCFPPIK